MKKLLAVLLAAVLAASAFAGYSYFDNQKNESLPESNPVPVQDVKSQESVNAVSAEPEKPAESAPVPDESVKPSEKNSEKAAEKPASSPAPELKVSKEDAKAAALKHAGLAEKDVKFLKVELDRERNGLVYEVEFDSGNYEYDYEVNAENGKVLKAEKEFKD